LLESSLETNKLETIILLLAPLLALALLAKKYRLSLRTLLRTLLRTKKACFKQAFLVRVSLVLLEDFVLLQLGALLHKVQPPP
jgi:hypothetical protein